MIGERLKKLRLDEGLTQEELANIFHTKKSTICTYETEKRCPPYTMVKKYIEFFGCTAEYLMGIDKLSIKESTDDFKYFTLTKEEQELITLIRKEKQIYQNLFTDPKRGIELIKIKLG